MTDALSPWRRILLASEHTEFDSGAERLAIDIARRTGASLTVVVPLVSNPQLVAEALAAPAEAAALDRRRELLRMAEAAGVRVDVLVREAEEAAQAVAECARETGADLVVVRRRGQRGFLASATVGVMAGGVAASAPCDVLMVPRAAEPWTRAVLAAVDPASSSAAVADAAASVAQACALPLHLTCVAETTAESATTLAQQALRRAIDELARRGTSAAGSVRSGKPADEIVAAAAEHAADLVVVGRGKARGPLQLTRMGSTAHKVVGRAAWPVLVVRT